jgi:hypothetical protein
MKSTDPIRLVVIGELLMSLPAILLFVSGGILVSIFFPEDRDCERGMLKNHAFARVPSRDEFWKATVSTPVAALFTGVITSELPVIRAQLAKLDRA